MMPPVVFSGPSLARAVVEAAGFVWRPPARQGDLRAVLAERPAAIGLVDGLFEAVPTVWHDEILAALDAEIPVFGAASIGALRAAELDTHGMVGVGTIYAAYRDGILEDDDEVALLHAPAELGFRPLTMPMVNVRAIVAAAALDPAVEDQIIRACKAVFYKERSIDCVEQIIAAHAAGPVDDWPDQKAADAGLLLQVIHQHQGR